MLLSTCFALLLFLLPLGCCYSTHQRHQQMCGDETCKCIPSQPCWPSSQQWSHLNSTLAGRLILNSPVALPCYPGPSYNSSECSYIAQNYASETWQQQFPMGYFRGEDVGCPLVTGSSGEGKCELGNAPTYAINASCVGDIRTGLEFAKRWNLRVVVMATGHDLLGRSTGKDGLEIWLHNFRGNITHHANISLPDNPYTGPAFTISGPGYTWSDVYPIAAQHNLIVVGGGTPSVGVMGGWMQGGGHGPATHDFGLGADQVLEAKVVLADGTLVTTSASENKELFFSIRGGGGGTYGIVIETTVKAYPTRKVLAQTLAFAPLSKTPNETEEFLQSVTELYECFPELAKAGWSGYGSWSTSSPVPLFGNFTTGYTHSLLNMKASQSEAEAAFDPILQKLRAKNGSELIVFVTYTSVPTYAEYYEKFSGVETPAGGYGATASRFLDEKALLSNRAALLETLRTLAGTSEQHTTNTLEFFGAPYGQIAVDGQTPPVSGLNSAWRSMIVNHITSRAWTANASDSVVEGVKDDVVCVKGSALRDLAPDTGAYMNENSALNPEWKEDFYGSNWQRLSKIKRTYDPDDLFYCPTCVGSEVWEGKDGQLCKVIQ